MLLERWHQTITRIRPGTKKERGSSVPDWDNAETLVITECLFNPNGTTLSQDGRVLGISSGAMACVPCDSDVKAGDRIRFGDDIYTIEGDPMIWAGVGRLNHMQLNLRRWRG